jgi:hypothetical protein
VEVARVNVRAAWIGSHGHAERTNDVGLPLTDREAAMKGALLALNAEHREAIAVLLEECREAAIHDLLARLQWMMDCDDFTMAWRGAKVPRGMTVPQRPFCTLHQDFGCRREGDPWLDEEQDWSGAPTRITHA